MKIISWNANGAFRNKFNRVKELDADFYIIQESGTIFNILGYIFSLTILHTPPFHHFFTMIRNGGIILGLGIYRIPVSYSLYSNLLFNVYIKSLEGIAKRDMAANYVLPLKTSGRGVSF